MRNIKIVFKIFVSLLLLSILFYNIDPHYFFSMLGNMRISKLIVAIFLIVSAVIVSGLKQHIIMQKFGIDMRKRDAVNLYFIGTFFNNFLPSTIGGDIIKMRLLKKKATTPQTPFFSIFVDRATGYLTLLLIALPAIIISSTLLNDKFYLIILISTYFLGILLTILLFTPFLRKIATSIFPQHLTKYIPPTPLHREFPIFQLLMIFALSFTFHILSIAAYFSVGQALGINLPLIIYFILVPFITIVSMIPISFNGVGIRETLFVFFLKSHTTTELATALPLVTYLLTVIVSLYGVIAYFCHEDLL